MKSDFRKYAAEQGIAEEEAREFTEQMCKPYAKARLKSLNRSKIVGVVN